jgi:hypothetical protein
VSRLTTLFLLRVRYLVEQPGRAPLLAEEVVVYGVEAASTGAKPAWLEDSHALALLADAKPDANVPMSEKRVLTEAALKEWPTLDSQLRSRITSRAGELEKSHKRVRQAVQLRVRELSVSPQFPPDLLGQLVLQPMV